MKKTKIFLIASLLIALVVIWIVIDNSKWEAINSSYINRVKTKSGRVDVELLQKRYLFNVIDSSVFSGFRPAKSLSKLYPYPHHLKLLCKTCICRQNNQALLL